MIQRFIELGEGFSDIYELLALAEHNRDRLKHMMAFHTDVKDRAVTSLAVVMEPTTEGGFQAIYICREGVPNPHTLPNKRYSLFEETAGGLGKTIIEMDVKPSTLYPEKALYYQHLIAILRLNHYIPPLQ
ncbi:hypothetical protein ANABIO32_38880 [Rossellomorea marisflavi]|uniref:DUF7147 family protein n=1 Tax=Rossellomorea marisflavi TaxID=189381 RepID=UPI0025CABE53|nr:methylthioribose kinase [Rossellomorea marisflavi]UTE71203.1 methylthioribose kinase [Rossellomorea marisflavi]GLI86113.1 hypothetical protein ANABIO32_38880 [Rossellomorea marisflavi]